ncbi:group 1 glycosyl transferase [Actinoplanes friuliensis DSM 7358]|uniref:Group 1 glycosyl transferase n=1 Tax=Actinoplanes friuliensis DSM 7358 TaxID=1246995 RepID=U5VS74_9ACTN|nr:group 1 glycosyl transferase [Actinoplanes friuliensis DSM 7358]
MVICNWRDSGHPMGGGAELYCERVAAELHADGVRVTYLTARAKGQSKREDTTFGTVVRGGGTYTVYLFVLLWLLLHRRTIDGVIDSQNGIPFFTPLALRRRTPVALLIHHVHQDQFLVHFPQPAARVGQFLENQASSWVYGKRAMAAVSPSSRAEIRRRLSLRGPVHLAPCGQEMPPPRHRRPAPVPRIVCVGRLVTQKRFDVLLRAMPELNRRLPGVELHLVGDGEARPELERLAAELGPAARVRFHGRVDDATRDALVDSAWVTASASMGEGWGLSIMEAAAAGVPAVAFSVPGLRDTIRPGETGWLVEPTGDLPTALADTLVEALRTLVEARASQEWSARCVAWAGRFTWAATAAHLSAVLTAEKNRLATIRVERRPGSDNAALIRLPSALLAGADLTTLRVTDLVEIDQDQAALLLTGADEQDGRRVLARIGVDASHPGVRVRLARHRDLLGWRTHPPTRGAAGERATGLAAVPPPRKRAETLARLAMVPAAVFVLALTVRLIAISRAYDIFVDEISYADVARNLATGQGLVLNGGPFHLHPPGFFLVLAGFFDLFGMPADTASLVLHARPVSAVAGAIVCAGTTLLLVRVVRLPIAATAGVLLAVDPFLLRFDSRVMLEAPAMAAAVVGLVLLTVRPRGHRTAVAWGVVCGLLLASAILTKEWYAFVTAVPLVLLCFSVDRVQRRMRLTALATTVLGYASYVLVMASLGMLPEWWSEKVGGLARAAGVHQATGFNQPGAESFTSRIAANLSTFGASYGLIVIGGMVTAALVVARNRRPWQFLFTAGGGSVVTALGVGAFAFIGYAVTLGTLEEQMFYPVMVTSVMIIAAGLDMALRAQARNGFTIRRRLTGAVAVAAAAVALIGDGSIWAGIRTTPDDTYRQLLAWAPRGFPADSTVAATEDVAQFVLSGVRLGQWSDLPALTSNNVDYVVVSTALAERGYGKARPDFVAALDRGAAVVFSAHGRTMGELRVYDVRKLVGTATARTVAVKAVTR